MVSTQRALDILDACIWLFKTRGDNLAAQDLERVAPVIKSLEAELKEYEANDGLEEYWQSDEIVELEQQIEVKDSKIARLNEELKALKAELEETKSRLGHGNW